MDSIALFPVDWGIHDIEYNGMTRAEIHAWGKSREGVSTLLRIAFTPYFFVRTPGWSESRQRLYISEASQKYKAIFHSSVPVKRVPLLGFTNNSPTNFIQLAFPTVEAFKRAKYGIPREHLATYEANLDPLLRFFHVRNIQPAHWIRATDVTAIDPEDPSRVSKPCVHEYVTDFKHVEPALDITDVPPLVIASWDLECISGSGMFPDSSRYEDKIITIGTAFQRYGETEPYLRSAITLDTCDPIPGVDVVACQNEADVVNEWLALLNEQHVDVMIGYNTSGFDYKYLDGRHSLLVNDAGEPEIIMAVLGKSARAGGEPVEKNLSSAAYGDNKYFYLTSPGVMTLDLLQIFRKELKLESYSLNNVSKKYLEDGDEKIDLKPGEIFKKFREGSSERAEIATYCVRDVELPLKLMRRLSTLENALQMANAVCCPIDFLQNRGQQIRVFSQLIRKARSLGFVCPDVARNTGEAPPEKYEGATVLDAKRGAYFDIISALDFASLYPSIIMAHNMCPSTLVLDPAYGNVEGIEYYEINTGAGVARFAQSVKCVVPELLRELAQFRKDAKKDMAATKDPFQKSVFNAKQLAYKVSMNSVYGFFGATRGMLPLVVMAAAVTGTGRHMIEKTKAMAEQLVPGSEVVYGDSVAGYTPIYLCRDGSPFVTTFDELADTLVWTRRSDGKEYADCGPVDIWSDKGWTRIEHVIRHAYNPQKGLLRVRTGSALVDVTPDHSLLDKHGRPIKPCMVSRGDVLLHRDTPQLKPRHMDIHGTDMIARSHKEAAEMFAQGVPMTFADGDTPETIRILPDDKGEKDQVVSVQKIEYTGPYVYDVTTSNHHFAAGIGRLVVHNTDSVMVRFSVPEESKHDMHEHFRIAERVADEITKTFQRPIELEFEKTYWPYLLFSKKRYAGLMYTKPDAPDYIDVKGLQLVRRDNAPIVKDVSTKILDTIMYERSPERAIVQARECVLRVLQNQEPMHKFIISKALRSGYKNPASLPHVTVADKIKQRRGYPPALGERIPYVFVRDAANPDGLVAQRAEDPDYVREHPEIELDTLYYVNNQIISPVTTLLEVLMESPKHLHAHILGHPDVEPLIKVLEGQKSDDIKVAKRIRLNKTNNQMEITKFFKTS